MRSLTLTAAEALRETAPAVAEAGAAVQQARQAVEERQAVADLWNRHRGISKKEGVWVDPAGFFVRPGAGYRVNRRRGRQKPPRRTAGGPPFAVSYAGGLVAG